MASLKQWVYLILLALTWGSSFILIKRGLFSPDGSELFTGIQVGALRIVFAGLFLAPLALKNIKLLRHGQAKFLLIVGVCGNALPALLFATAQTHIPSALAGMLNATVPLFSLIIAYFIFKVKVNKWQIIGLFIGLFAAIGLMMSSGGTAAQPVNLWYAILVLIATICYAISLNTIKQFLKAESAVAITALALLLVMPIGAIILFNTDFVLRISANEYALQGIGAVAILGIVGTALALILFNQLVKDTNTIFASSVTYLIPLVAIAWGLLDNETIGTDQILFALIMLGGVILINRK